MVVARQLTLVFGTAFTPAAAEFRTNPESAKTFKNTPAPTLSMPRPNILPLAAMEKLMRKAGAPRVADNAKTELADALEEFALQLSAEALKFSQHAGRKTVTAVDIRLARRKS